MTVMYIWMEAVTVWEGNSVKRTLTDVQGAANFLLERWPEGEDTDFYHAARQAALDALTGDGTVEAFRASFIAAANHAEILADPPSLGITLG